MIFLALAVGFLFQAAMYGPLAAFIAELFDTRDRYSGASLGYQLISVFGGAVAPPISVALLSEYGSTLPVSLYLLVMAVITFLAAILAPESAKKVWRIDDRREEATYSGVHKG